MAKSGRGRWGSRPTRTGQLGDRIELSWASGLFEGEGCFTSRSSERSYPVAVLTMTDEDSVRRFHRAVGVGKVRGPFQNEQMKQPAWGWKAGGFESVQHVVASLWAGLGKRRKTKAMEVLLYR